MSDCLTRDGKLFNCLKATEDENGQIQCQNCTSNFPLIWNDIYNQTVCDNKCASDSFLLESENWCYKCDHNTKGNIGCIANEGCDYDYLIDKLYCNDCKIGYFHYKNICLKCSTKDENCEKCHFNSTENKFKCDKCKEE